MAESNTPFIDRLRARLQERLLSALEAHGETTIEIAVDAWADAARTLRDDPDLSFEQLIDLCGVDYLGWGDDEWETDDVTDEGFSRGVEGSGPGRFRWEDRPQGAGPEKRFAAVVHLLSVRHNRRLRVRAFCTDDEVPMMPTVVDVWPAANWFEREAFDLFGILFDGHPDLRRILTDYGFIGHPFRKDFPLIGNVEVRYDPAKKRVIYQPVTINPRTLVPRVIREDHRYDLDEG